MDIEQLIDESFENAKEKGFHDNPREFGTALALIHSEVSEALEEHRIHGLGPEVAEEFADIMIRVADTSKEFGIPIVSAIKDKLKKNKTRSHKHGKNY